MAKVICSPPDRVKVTGISASIEGSLVTNSANYVTIDESGNIVVGSTSTDTNAVVSIDSASHTANLAVNSSSTDNYNLTFNGGTAVAIVDELAGIQRPVAAGAGGQGTEIHAGGRRRQRD